MLSNAQTSQLLLSVIISQLQRLEGTVEGVQGTIAGSGTENSKKDPRPIPTCPPKPADKPKVPSKDWRVLWLRTPKCVENDDKELEWVFTYYSNKITGEVRWTAPPPEGALQLEEDKDILDLTNGAKKVGNPGSMNNYVVRPPSDDAYARELLGESEPEEQVQTKELDTEPAVTETNAEPSSPTPAQLTFTGMVPVKLFMRPKDNQPSFPKKAREVGVGPTGLTRQQLTQALRQHFLRVHNDELSSYHASDCFRPEYQDINRKRAETSRSIKKRKTVEKACGKKKKKPKRQHHKAMQVKVRSVCVFYGTIICGID